MISLKRSRPDSARHIFDNQTDSYNNHYFPEDERTNPAKRCKNGERTSVLLSAPEPTQNYHLYTGISAFNNDPVFGTYTFTPHALPIPYPSIDAIEALAREFSEFYGAFKPRDEVFDMAQARIFGLMVLRWARFYHIYMPDAMVSELPTKVLALILSWLDQAHWTENHKWSLPEFYHLVRTRGAFTTECPMQAYYRNVCRQVQGHTFRGIPTCKADALAQFAAFSTQDMADVLYRQQVERQIMATWWARWTYNCNNDVQRYNPFEAVEVQVNRGDFVRLSPEDYLDKLVSMAISFEPTPM